MLIVVFVCCARSVFVVLGCEMSLLDGRVDASLQHANSSSVVVFSGGGGESLHARDRFVRRWRLPVLPTLLVENKSRTTLENVMCTKKLLEKHQINGDRVVVVTDVWHSFRALALFRKHFSRVDFVGTNVWSPIPLTHVIWTFREIGAIAKAIVKKDLHFQDLL